MAVLCPSFAIGNCPIRAKHSREESITTHDSDHLRTSRRTIHCRTPRSFVKVQFNFSNPPLLSLSFRPYFLLRRCLIIFRFSCFPFPFVFSFLSCLFSWSSTQWFFDVSLMVISMEKKRVHGVRFTGEENFSTMNSDRFSSYPFLCSPANCFFPSVQSEPEWRSPPVFRPRRLPQTGY